ncbi:MAG TPA: hypothetical protein VHO04_13430 [Sphingopyxis sp.]|uniref:hypothetical protein n=1 Tax=Sphingopyxis sp. TaxID=1908224 RepID=UPI002E30E312|nr:hypothetical protein [Sphingopyxis sp.]HEX2813672.1 hypothetical protein [Sphingopyxis sp.]
MTRTTRSGVFCAIYGEHQILDFPRRDIFTSADDDVLLAIRDSEIGFVIKHPDSARQEPAARQEDIVIVFGPQ